MNTATYRFLKSKVAHSPYSNDIEWAEKSIHPPDTALEFFCEYAFVVINSGMKAQIARKIYEKTMDAVIVNKQSATAVFGHPGKSAAIDQVFSARFTLFDQYCASTDRLVFLEALPWIGPITKYHLAKNFGMDVVKPDRHLVRIAEKSGETPEELCRRIAKETGDTVAVVDTVIWRAANMGLA